ncbi:MAG: SusC/RagA family TonB-linked outer membrane protein [Prevotellaceae bacterium]|nr:SusC/RagA family TonB-linked outer membrane protein [Candidatus Minthosoma caballi]
MNKIKFIITSIVLFFCVSSAMAQQRRITGTVYDDLGGIMAANVVERDANNRIVEAAVTDMNGNFSMVIKNPKDVLVVSYVGYKTWSQVIGTTTKFNIKMQDNTQLAEVVVKAKPKVNSNGMSIPLKEISVATQTMNMDDVEGLSFTSADEALQGKIAGLDIVANSGNLGAGTSMRLRGVSTIHGSAEPLIVVDGNIFDLPDGAADINFEDMDNEEQFATLLSVNTEDIKEIKVLKDAAATAIWGVRGSNGVLEITTRRGVAGKTKINFSYKFSGSWAPSGLNMLNGDGYTMMLKEAYFNPKQNTATADMVELNYDPAYPVQYHNFNKNTDWVDAVNQFGQSHDYFITLNGGGEKARFRISGGYKHQTGTIIKQSLDQFSTRLVLDYDVSDRIRFSTNFALTYTDNHRNWDGGSTSSILGKAYNAMPNMSIYEYDQNGELTGDFYKMLPSGALGAAASNYYSSYYLSDMKNNGNPVAIANQAFNNQSTYRITPQFNLEYKLLSKDGDGHQLNLNAEVYMDIFNKSENAYMPASLSTKNWKDGVNGTTNDEFKSLGFTNREKIIFVPKFNNENVTMSFMGQFEFTTGNSSSQYVSQNGLPSGMSSSSAGAYLLSSTSGTGEWRSMSYLGSGHIGLYDGRYSFDVTVRRDGSTRFGKGNKWGTFPGISARWNISDEPFFEKLKVGNVISMLAFKPSWGKNGLAPSHEYLMYNKYSSTGVYGQGNYVYNAISPDNLRLTNIMWETLTSWNLGAILGVFNDLVTFDFNYYNRQKDDLLMQNVGVPGSTGFGSLSWRNVGGLRNRGWELLVTTGKFIKTRKFSMSANFNMSQNVNTITDMDPTVLSSMNGEYGYRNAEYLKRIQVGNAVGSIYGFKFAGVYRYDYEHNGYTDLSSSTYGENTAAAAAARGENATVPVARDANGNILFDSKGNPLHMYFNYGGLNYEFKGGDVIYEDINHDGQINELDIVYLGNSNPKMNGGFGLNFNYGDWSLKLSFNYRWGNKIANTARLNNESMRSNINQSQAVAWRWRKNGDITEIPRAMNATIGASYNSLASDRFVENGDFLRLQYMQIGYNVPSKVVKNWGLQSLRLNASANNLFCLTKYTGVDPEVSYGAWGVCYDNSKTPRAKSFTVSINVGF